jgi:hypothetical protein
MNVRRRDLTTLLGGAAVWPLTARTSRLLSDRCAGLVQINWGVQGRFRLIFSDPPPH